MLKMIPNRRMTSGGLNLSLQGLGNQPKDSFISKTSSNGASYNSTAELRVYEANLTAILKKV